MEPLVVAFAAQRNGLLIVTVRGEADLVGKPLLCTCVQEALESGNGPLVIDLAGVSFIDAQGLSALVMCRRQTVALGRGLTLAGVPVVVSRLLTLTALEHSFTIVA